MKTTGGSDCLLKTGLKIMGCRCCSASEHLHATRQAAGLHSSLVQAHTFSYPGKNRNVEQRQAAGANEQHEDVDEWDGGVGPSIAAQDIYGAAEEHGEGD